MAATVVERIKVIDADSHISEPENLWTNRVSTQKWGELVPHVQYDEAIKEDRWFMGGKPFMPTAGAAMAGWKEPPPDHPPSLEEADHGSWSARDRLQRMDEYGIWAQVIYPNVGGFGSGNFLALKDPELMYECVKAYNDFLLDWCSIDMKRFIPIMAMPFWDVDLCVKEMERCAKGGHKGVLMTNQPHVFDMPRITERHWDPLWHQATDLGMSINFHIGSGDLTKLRGVTVDNGRQAAYAKATVSIFLDNSQALMDITLSGLCHRFPKLNFVSVESGVGWVPFLLEAMDWQWLNSGCREEHPEMDLLPSEYFKRQCYACFWFEEKSALSAIEQIGPDNLLYETDFPHPTSMSPGPNSVAVYPKDFIEEHLGHLPEDSLKKLLQTNSARIYHLEV
ncbi:MAG: amidohydrolase [Chloroflexi bacterium]|nr:amidohydrolase [Chloroflexota bacterium]